MAAQNQPEHGSLGIGSAALLAFAALTLPLRHRYPVGVLAATFGATLAYFTLDSPGGPVFVSLIAALVHVVLIGRRAVAITALVAGFLLFPWLGYLLGSSDRPNLLSLFGLAAWLVALISVTEVVKSRRDRAREAARSAAEALRRQASDERVRIARDLHDSVAHNMSLISIQAGVALHLLGDARGDDAQGEHPRQGSSEQVAKSLTVIKEASKEALVELRSVLGVLRHVDEVDEQPIGASDETDDPSEDPAPATAPRAPIPTLRRLDTLVTRAGSVGLDVQLELPADQGTLSALPRSVDLAAFRIIQESLTNVSRHSDSPTALVRIAKHDGMLTVKVLDEGSGHVQAKDLPRGGNGIVGMKERAAAVGGRLEAGPRPGRGFAVRAELPLGSGPRDEPGDAP